MLELHGHILEWRLREIMEARGITTVVRLHELVDSQKPGHISRSRLYQIVDIAPRRIDIETLLLLVIILKCDIGDLLQVSTPSSRKHFSDLGGAVGS